MEFEELLEGPVVTVGDEESIEEFGKWIEQILLRPAVPSEVIKMEQEDLCSRCIFKIEH